MTQQFIPNVPISKDFKELGIVKIKVVLLLRRIIEPRLSRVCFEEMEGLRDGWDMLLQTSEEVYATLVREKRGTFEQELDKQVKVRFEKLHLDPENV